MRVFCRISFSCYPYTVVQDKFVFVKNAGFNMYCLVLSYYEIIVVVTENQASFLVRGTDFCCHAFFIA